MNKLPPELDSRGHEGINNTYHTDHPQNTADFVIEKTKQLSGPRAEQKIFILIKAS